MEDYYINPREPSEWEIEREPCKKEGAKVCEGALDDDRPCGDEGNLCRTCMEREYNKWAEYFGQVSGDPVVNSHRLQTMDPRPASKEWANDDGTEDA